MELTEKEKMLIEAVREIGEVPANVLLWYAAGLELNLNGASSLRTELDRRKIDIANAWMRSM